MSATSAGWLDERADRPSLVVWLTIAAARLGGPFLDGALVDLLNTGRMNDGQERGVRRARARSLSVGDRGHPEVVGRKTKV